MDWASDASRFVVLLLVGAVGYVVATVYLDEFVTPLELGIFGLGLLAVLGLFRYYADELHE
jgi:1,4-dihydroxy-2-naphthoate octaprenyltransferase